MDSYRLTEQAQRALESIVVHTLQRYGVGQPERMAESVFSTADWLADFPGAGHRRPDLTDEAVLF